MATWIESSVDLKTEIAFGNDPWATTPTWTDVSAYVRNIAVSRGSSSETAVFSPGRCSITFANQDRRFDPDYSSSPYSPSILPMKRVRVTATRSAVTFTVFLGWVTGWVQDWQVGDGVAYAECVDGGYFMENESLAASAYGAAVLEDSPIMYVPMQKLEGGRSFLDLMDRVPLAPNDQNIAQIPNVVNRGTFPIGETFAMQPTALGVGLNYNNFNVSTVTPPKTVEAWVFTPTDNDQSRWSLEFTPTNNDSIQLRLLTGSLDGLWIDYTNTADNRSLVVGPVVTRANLSTSGGAMTHIAATFSGTTATVYVNGAVVYSAALSVGVVSAGTSLVYAGASWDAGSSPAAVSHYAAYSTALSADRVMAHYLAGITAYGDPYGECEGTRITRVLDEIGYPSNLRDISPGGIVQGPYLPAERRAMEYIGDCVTSGQGLLFFSVDGKLTYRDRAWQWISADADGVVFSDDGGAGSVGYDQGSPNSGTIDTVRNIVTVSYSDVGGITNRDATSITAYGPSQEFIDGPTIRNGTDASNLGKYVLRLKKDPKSTIPELLVKLRANIATNLAACLGLELGEVVTVERTPMGVGSQIVRRHQVTGISHTITPEDWEVRFYLSPAVPMADEVPYFTIAHATYGRVGAPAGNKIPG